MMKAHLRAAKTKKQIIGALDTGAFILAHCGVLEGYQATVHYEHIDAFQELFPNITVSEALWVMDHDRITCCGGMAAAEFAMRLIEQTHGTALVNAIAKYLFSQKPAGRWIFSKPRTVGTCWQNRARQPAQGD